MKNKKNDYNQLLALCENFCKHGLSAGSISYLPIKYPVWYKIRVSELFAEYKMFPARISHYNHFPDLGLCIIFIPFTHGLLGWHEKTTSPEERAFFQYWIHHNERSKILNPLKKSCKYLPFRYFSAIKYRIPLAP